MPAFEYTALDGSGNRRKDVLEADSSRQARQILRDQGLNPIDVKSAATGRKVSKGAALQFSELMWWRRGMTTLEVAMFTRQLSTLITAGLPVEEALGAVAQQTGRRTIGTMIVNIRSKVLEGHSLAAALEEYPATFDSMYRSTVASGEQSGFLGTVLGNLADYTEKRFEARRNVEMAMFYPVLLFVASLAIVSMLLIFVVPDIVEVFDKTEAELPLITSLLIGASEFLQTYFYLLIVAAVVVIVGIRWLFQKPDIKIRWDRYLMSLPLLGRITVGGNAARYANTLAILHSSGVPLVDAMNISAEVIDNAWMKQHLLHAVQRVIEGSSLRVALEGAGNFPPMFLYMIASGESSGELNTMLAKVADYQQQEIERLVATIVRLFEPLMLLGMAALVLMIVLAILLPILNMNQLMV